MLSVSHTNVCSHRLACWSLSVIATLRKEAMHLASASSAYTPPWNESRSTADTLLGSLDARYAAHLRTAAAARLSSARSIAIGDSCAVAFCRICRASKQRSYECTASPCCRGSRSARSGAAIVGPGRPRLGRWGARRRRRAGRGSPASRTPSLMFTDGSPDQGIISNLERRGWVYQETTSGIRIFHSLSQDEPAPLHRSQSGSALNSAARSALSPRRSGFSSSQLGASRGAGAPGSGGLRADEALPYFRGEGWIEGSWRREDVACVQPIVALVALPTDRLTALGTAGRLSPRRVLNPCGTRAPIRPRVELLPISARRIRALSSFRGVLDTKDLLIQRGAGSCTPSLATRWERRVTSPCSVQRPTMRDRASRT